MPKLIEKIIPDYGDASNQDVRARYGYLEGKVSIAGNIILFIAKLLIGIMILSISLIADAVHTLSDILSSVVVILGFRESKRKPDKEHPFGHGRVEHIATLIIAIFLIAVGIELIFDSAHRLLGTAKEIELRNAGEYVILIPFAIIVFATAKELMARYSTALGRRIKSDTLIADAWHHRTDAVATLLVLIAIFGAMYGLNKLDAIFGIAVSFLIIYTGMNFARCSIDTLIGKAPDEDVLRAIEETARSVNGVEGAHSIQVHDYVDKKVVSLHIEVAKGISAEKAHEIADRVEKEIVKKVSNSAIVHIDPVKERSKEILEIEGIVKRIVEEDKNIKSYHEVKVEFTDDAELIEMHIIVDKSMNVEATHKLFHDLSASIKRLLPNAKVNVHIEPCPANCKICKERCNAQDEV